MPPDRKAPTGTSAISRRRTDRRNSASRWSTASRSSPPNVDARVDDVEVRPVRLGLADRAVGGDRHGVPGRELGDALVDRPRRGHVLVAEVQGQRVTVDVAVELGMAAQRVERRSEHDVAGAQPAVEQRLLAEPVARQHELALASGPTRRRRTCRRPVRALARTPQWSKASSRISVSEWPRNRTPRAAELGGQLAVVVDLAVVGDDEAAAGRRHRLVAGGREVEDGQPAVAEADSARRVASRLPSRRAPRASWHRPSTSSRRSLSSAATAVAGIENADDPAHQRATSSYRASEPSDRQPRASNCRASSRRSAPELRPARASSRRPRGWRRPARRGPPAATSSPEHAVLDDLGQPADTGRHHREAERVGLHQRHRQAFVARREAEEVGRRQQVVHVVAETEEAEPVAEASRVRRSSISAASGPWPTLRKSRSGRLARWPAPRRRAGRRRPSHGGGWRR